MSTFKDFAAFANTLKLPIFGKTYEIPPVGAKTGAEIHMLIAQAEQFHVAQQENAEILADAKKRGVEPELKELPEEPRDPDNRDLLGPVIDEMFEDNVPAEMIRAAAFTAYYDFIVGREAAEVYWNSGGDPKALERYISRPMNSRTSGAGATTTKKPASTSGTKSRTKNSRSTTSAAKKSATPKSSKNGDSSKGRSKPD